MQTSLEKTPFQQHTIEYFTQKAQAYEILTGVYTKPDNDYLDNILNDGDW
ncbi:hypothetical protein [Niabella aurantiaca]|nr:hypothetical protein [Niabella aurantiaca]